MTNAGTRLGSTASSSSGARPTSACRLASSSMRASGAPMQTWMPPPKPMCSAAFGRPTSRTSGSAKKRGSRLAKPNRAPSVRRAGVGVVADQLFDGGGCRHFAGDETPPLPGVAEQRADAVAECVHSRFVTRVEEERRRSRRSRPRRVRRRRRARRRVRSPCRRAVGCAALRSARARRRGIRRPLAPPTAPAPRSCRTRASSRGGATSPAGRGDGRSARRAAGR